MSVFYYYIHVNRGVSSLGDVSAAATASGVYSSVDSLQENTVSATDASGIKT